ncbi:MAG: gamma-glutamyl-gamma-aminobutyrate hydrolase family protein [Ruminococcus sp.]|nr:gamma-glutamyl-gamma-aminobutyrate hydrolase family protein [Ruminococcus sp.]
MKPKIGIVVCGFIDKKQFVSNAYIQSIRYSGGIPVILPLVRSDTLIDEYINLCDGFLFCGGNDITPLLFGEEPKNGNGRTNISLDLFQIRLMKHILQTKKPIFCICRGMQVLNVACNGTIYQDISLQTGSSLDHMQKSDSREEVSHKIKIKSGTQLKKYIGRHLYVNSFHHQAVKKTGENLIVSATASDGTIEAIEMPSHPFALGVQWHPESMYRTSPEMRDLFHIFVANAKTGSVS